MTRLKIGERVELRHEVERFPHFVVAAGEQGTVSYNHQDEHGGTIAVRMDNPIDGAEEWNNEVQWDAAIVNGVLVSANVLSARDLKRIDDGDNA